jgi:hypothetical protein
MSIPLTHKYITAHFPGLVTITHKYMSAHFPGLIPLTHKYMTAHFPGLITLTHKYTTAHFPERLCICVLGVSTFPLSTIVLLNCTVDNHDLVNSYKYMCNKWPRIVSVCRIHNPSLSSFTTNHRVCIESNTTGAINKKGTAHITGAPDFILAFAVFVVLNRWLPRSVL